jgi:xylulokinase
MHVGIDLGTSSVKAVLIDDAGEVAGESSSPLAVSRPRPGWSEQDPQAWWQATIAAVAGLDARARTRVRGLGLSGQMHGAVLVDAQNQIIRQAILWNDGRSQAACRELERREPRSRDITANLAMPGFTAPKLVWLAEHEPDHFRRIARVLLPKDWLRFRLVGDFVSEPSDAAGTLFLDVPKRCWSPEMLAACNLDVAKMPRLVEGTEVSGQLASNAAAALGLPAGIPVAGGGGDNACGAVGIGADHPNAAFLSLGTSGVIFVADAQVRPDPDRGVHAFCHCIPQMWHRMAVILSAASTLSYVSQWAGATNETEFLADIERETRASTAQRLVMLPYLSGERTPHNDPAASGVFFGLDSSCTRVDLGRAALEGVAFALADGLDALEAHGEPIDHLSVIGGGSRSRFWGTIIAAALGRTLVYHRGGETGPALGAARLSRIATGDASVEESCRPPPVADVIEPDASLREALAPRRALFRRLYADLRQTFAASA